MINSEKIVSYIENKPKWKKELETLRQLMLESGVEETVKWGIPVYMVNGKNIVGIAAFKNHVSLWFYQGALLKDQAQKLINAGEGKTKALRQWRFQSEDEIDKKRIAEYLKEAIGNALQGKEIKPEKKAPTSIPDLLKSALKSDKQLRANFDSLPPYKQREFTEQINSAKREETKISRLEKALLLIKAGKGLHDKYRS